MPPDRRRACRSGRRAGPRRGCGAPGRRRGRAPRRAPTPVTSASTSRETGTAMVRQPPEAALLLVVEQLVRRVHRLRRATRSAPRWSRPTRAICTAICSMSSGSPPVACSSRRTSSSCATRSTGCPPAASTPVQEQLDGRPGQRLVRPGHGAGADPDDTLGRLPGHGHRREGQRGRRWWTTRPAGRSGPAGWGRRRGRRRRAGRRCRRRPGTARPAPSRPGSAGRRARRGRPRGRPRAAGCPGR